MVQLLFLLKKKRKRLQFFPELIKKIYLKIITY